MAHLPFVPNSVGREEGKATHRDPQTDPVLFCRAWTSPGLGFGHYISLDWSVFVFKNFQLVYSQSHLLVGLETASDLSLCFCNLPFLSLYVHVHITWSIHNPGRHDTIWEMSRLRHNVLFFRFPDFSTHAYSIALSCIWHLVFFPTRKWFFVTYCCFYYSVLVEILGCKQPFQNV